MRLQEQEPEFCVQSEAADKATAVNRRIRLFGFGLASSPDVDEEDEHGGEASLLRVAELRWVAPHHLSQLIKHAVPLRVREPSGGQFVLKQTVRASSLLS